MSELKPMIERVAEYKRVTRSLYEKLHVIENEICPDVFHKGFEYGSVGYTPEFKKSNVGYGITEV